MPNSPLELFWLCAHAENPVLPYDQFRMIPEDVRSSLLDAGLLKEGQPSRAVECNGCDEGHVEEVQQIDYADGKRRFFILCPECRSVEINPKRLKQWVPDYSKVAELLHQNLKCRGTIQTAIPQMLWNIGRAPLAGQSRPIWLARAINDEVKQNLPTGKQPILFIIFPQQDRAECFDSDRTFQVSQLVFMEDGQLQFDIDAVKAQLGYVAETNTPAPKASRKDAKRAAAIKAAKKELHQHILSMKSLLANTDQKLPHLTQKQLAERLKASETMVSNILTKEPDELLGILWQTANSPDMIRKYSRKIG